MRTHLFPLSLFILLPVLLSAQPKPCGQTPDMTSFCKDACIICDINGYTGINNDPEIGEAPPGFCTSTVHHMQWIGFIAGSTELTLNVKVSNCQTGYGLEIGIYESLDCQNFKLVSNCDGDVLEGETGVFKNTTPLTIGQYYYFVMDGNHGDVCNYTISVVNGSTAVLQLPDSGELNGDLTVCPGRQETYQVDAPTGATWFSWTLDGQPLAAGVDTSVQVNWQTQGLHQLCVTASNVCDTAPPACRFIEVKAIPPTFITADLCAGECWQGADTVLCMAGLYTFQLSGHEGCDSTVNVQISTLPTAQTDLDLMICKGDTIRIGNQPCFTNGTFQELLTNEVGCDSLVTLNLQVIVCEIKGALTPEPIACNGLPNGKLRFRVNDGTPPFQYTWERIAAAQPSGSGSISATGQEILIQNLPKGTYFVTITDNFGHSLILFDEVVEPLPLTMHLEQSDYNGYGVSCSGSHNGRVEASGSGGSAPYTFIWSTGDQGIVLENRAAGLYTCTLTDANGCTTSFSSLLTAPLPLEMEADFEDPGCAGLNSGSATVTATAGGVEPYLYDCRGAGFLDEKYFENLAPGACTVAVRDANGCIADTTGFLNKPLIPEIVPSPDVTVNLSESAPLFILPNVPLASIQWSPAVGLSCTDCPKPVATPYLTTTYYVSVLSAGSGCPDADSVTVYVTERRNVYIPNVFSPNDDGRNDRFTVFGGPEVEEVTLLQVWSRWGELVYENRHFAANREQAGWVGRWKEQDLPTGVYAWVASVRFLDGVTLQYQGDVTLVR